MFTEDRGQLYDVVTRGVDDRKTVYRIWSQDPITAATAVLLELGQDPEASWPQSRVTEVKRVTAK